MRRGPDTAGSTGGFRRHAAEAVSGVAMSYLVTAAALTATVAAPAVLGWRPHLAVSGSMEPMFGPGDVVLVAPAAPGRFYEAPAVITYRTGDGVVTHRVAETHVDGGAGSYVTKGDANRQPDSAAVDHDRVVGAVRLVVPLVGRPVLWVQHRRWVPLLAWLATVVAALSALDPERLLRRRTPAPRRRAVPAAP